MNRDSKAKWKADIDDSKPGADFFLARTPAEYNLVAYFKHRGATSSSQEDITYELSEWIKFFSASDKQILRDVASSFRSQWKSMSKFWDEIVERESQQRQLEQVMEKRKIDLRRQNVDQFRIDGDAMTRELDEALGGMSAGIIL
ncbi:hypothetical protein BGW38_009626 [Lunasporangiospora selenospora]|uniref:Uncharacterized protein n=1 Tax=Lunasporangiospora selenospora TaxID=979761 RepID=A0A9P6K599_9FUNG|nr:hypothetical protein BGW38_009626 [Lunasporangiospora selenospora]